MNSGFRETIEYQIHSQVCVRLNANVCIASSACVCSFAESRIPFVVVLKVRIFVFWIIYQFWVGFFTLSSFPPPGEVRGHQCSIEISCLPCVKMRAHTRSGALRGSRRNRLSNPTASSRFRPDLLPSVSVSLKAIKLGFPSTSGLTIKPVNYILTYSILYRTSRPLTASGDGRARGSIDRRTMTSGPRTGSMSARILFTVHPRLILMYRVHVRRHARYGRRACRPHGSEWTLTAIASGRRINRQLAVLEPTIMAINGSYLQSDRDHRPMSAARGQKCWRQSQSPRTCCWNAFQGSACWKRRPRNRDRIRTREA